MESIYRAAAEKIVDSAFRLMDTGQLPLDLTVAVDVQGENITVTCKADHIAQLSSAIEVYRFKMTKLAKKESPKLRYIAVQAAIHQKYPGRKVEFHHVSLLTGDRQDGTAKKLKNDSAKLGEAILGARAGNFDPDRSDRECPRCPFFFVCPAHSSSSLQT